MQAQQKHFSALGEGGNYLFPTQTTNVAGFTFAEIPLGPDVRLQFGGRVEHVSIDGTPASNVLVNLAFTPVSGSAGFLWEAAPGVKLGFTATSAARVPGQTELFARGPHDGPGTYETGNPNLHMERANSVEGTVRWRTDIVDFEGAAWGAKFKNFIYGRLTGVMCDDDGNCGPAQNELRQLFYEQRDAAFWGLEGKTTVSVYQMDAGTVGTVVMADYVRARLANGGGNVPRMPPYHVGGGLAWNSKPFDASFMLKYSGTQSAVAFAETSTKGYASLDAQIAWRPWQTKPNLEISLVGHNLTNRIQRNAVAINKDEVVLPGRDIRVVLRSAF